MVKGHNNGGHLSRKICTASTINNAYTAKRGKKRKTKMAKQIFRGSVSEGRARLWSRNRKGRGSRAATFRFSCLSNRS